MSEFITGTIVQTLSFKKPSGVGQSGGWSGGYRYPYSLVTGLEHVLCLEILFMGQNCPKIERQC